ncbi:MAG: response regulator transcription factor [Bdellovibrionia bacterium]
MQRPKVLLVEDSEEFQIVVSEFLGRDFDISFASTEKEALTALSQSEFDLILLDIVLLSGSGYRVLSELQRDPELSDIPIICISSRGSLPEKVMAFNLGADDYLVKPFEFIEFRARVEAKIKKRQRQESDQSVLKSGALELDRNTYRATLTVGSDKVDLGLSPIEFKILAFFIKNRERVLTREQILTGAWGNDSKAFDRAVDVHVCSLRKKLRSHSRSIKAIHGLGYQFVPPTASLAP